MRKLLKIECIKLFGSPTVKAILAIHTLLFMLILLVGSGISINVQGVQVDKLFEFPMVWQTFAWIASWFNLLLGVLVIVVVTTDHQLRTYRKHLIDGLSRKQIVGSKVLVIISLSVYTTLMVLVAGLIFGLSKTASITFENVIQGLQNLPILFVQSLSYMVFAMFLAFLLKNPAIAIVSFILLFFPIEPVIAAILPSPIDEYLPFAVMSDLTPSPDFMGAATMGAFSQIHNIPEDAGISSIKIIQSLAYSLVFLLVSQFVVSKRNF